MEKTLQNIYDEYKETFRDLVENLKNKEGNAWECINIEFKINVLLEIAKKLSIEIIK